MTGEKLPEMGVADKGTGEFEDRAEAWSRLHAIEGDLVNSGCWKISM